MATIYAKPGIDTLMDKITNYQPLDNTYREKYNNALDSLENYKGYGDTINQKLGELANWQYDPSKDASYQAMSQLYQQNGQKAMKDTLAQVSSRTGGLASSYAGNAAQQTYDGYMQQLASLLPQYEQNAYNRLGTTLGAYQNWDDNLYNRLYGMANLYGDAQNQGLNYLNDLMTKWYQYGNAFGYNGEWDQMLAGAGGGTGGGYTGNSAGGNPSAFDQLVNQVASDVWATGEYRTTPVYDALINNGATKEQARNIITAAAQTAAPTYKYNPLYDIK